jgi:hypothetical protein
LGLVTCLPVTARVLATQLSADNHPVGLLADPAFLVRQIDRFLHLLSGSIAAGLLLTILIAGAGWATVRAVMRQGAETPVELEAALWLGIFAAATWLIAYALTIVVLPIVSMRNMLVTAPPIYLALACVIACWSRANGRTARAGIAMTMLYILLSAASPLIEHDPLKLSSKKDWIASAERINELDECVA